MKIGLIGYGELGRQIEHFIRLDRSDCEFIYFDDIAHANKIENSLPFNSYVNAVHKDLQFIVALGYNHLAVKYKIINDLIANNHELYTFIHHSAIVDPSATIGKGCIIYPACVIDKNVVISAGTLINLSVTISHDSVIGSACFFSPRAVVCGASKIGDRCFIGANATIIDNITLVDDCLVGAGAIVVRDLIEKATYIGVPAKKARDNGI